VDTTPLTKKYNINKIHLGFVSNPLTERRRTGDQKLFFVHNKFKTNTEGKVVKFKSLTVACLLVSTNTMAGDVAILSTTVVEGLSSPEAVAVFALGHTPIIIQPETWEVMSQTEFSMYEAIVLGDPDCVDNDSPIAAAAANSAWALASNGNVILIGSDPTFHINHGPSAGPQVLVDSSMAFALADAGTGITGAFVTLSCYYHWSSQVTSVPFLQGFGTFAVVGADITGALNNVHIIASHPTLAGLTGSDLSNWFNSVHENFGMLAKSWPSDFEVLAIAVGSGGNFTAPDGTVGYPYILARGVIPDFCGDGNLNPAEECDDNNNTNGDGCDKACNIEDTCIDSDGDGVCDADDICEGNDASGDSDADGICNDLDQCPSDPINDEDEDGFCHNDDNCPMDSNPDQADTDGDGTGDACDNDNDNDGILDDTDNCPLDSNPDQADSDGDGAGDVCDADSDGDGVIDAYDACVPTPVGEVVNSNGCSISQLCPCDNNWKNHGFFVKCNAHATEAFVEAGLMTEAEKDTWMSQAGQSSCGHK
jgi:cysteine-rich repeat protein